jgi:hypothetical protein
VTLAPAGDLDERQLPRVGALYEYDLSIVAANGPAAVRHSVDGYSDRHPSVSSKSGISPIDKATSSNPCMPAR